MLSAGQTKKINGQDANPLAPKPFNVKEDFLNYQKPSFQKISELPRCEFEGAPEIKTYPDTYLEEPYQLWVLPQEHVTNWKLDSLKDYLLDYRKETYSNGTSNVAQIPKE